MNGPSDVGLYSADFVQLFCCVILRNYAIWKSSFFRNSHNYFSVHASRRKFAQLRRSFTQPYSCTLRLFQKNCLYFFSVNFATEFPNLILKKNRTTPVLSNCFSTSVSFSMLLWLTVAFESDNCVRITSALFSVQINFDCSFERNKFWQQLCNYRRNRRHRNERNPKGN